jgi:carboxyl-terminal processing protease
VRRLYSRAAVGLCAFLATCLVASATIEPLPPLSMSERHPQISRNVTQLIEELHYSRPRLDNSLSSAILDRYLDTLDGNRVYFLASDINRFSRYRYELDERTRNGRLEPVFEIFNLFRQRTAERVSYAIDLLAEEPDYSVDETFRFDRSEIGWPVSEEEMRDVWRKRVKSDGLRLLLAGQTWEQVAETLAERYERIYTRVAQLTPDDAFETYMNAVAHTIDPHSSYLSPRQSEEYRISMSLSYDGIGASLQTDNDYVVVVDLIAGGPAQIDGTLRPQDRIMAVAEGDDGEFVEVIGMRLDDVVRRIRGPGGTKIRLRVLPAGAAPGSPERVVDLIRDKVRLEEQAAKSELMDVELDGEQYRIGVIKLPSFYQDFAARTRGDADYRSTTRDVARLLLELQDQGIDGLVMDLRQNGGGHLSEATELSGLFVDRGPVVQLREVRGNVQVLDSQENGAIYDGPLAVLVDRFSASASEIFAAAIQDYRRGIVIGQQTFGKGSVQNLFNLDRVMRGSDNGQLTLTVGKYYRVTGESTQHRGVIPDIELPSLVPTDQVGESTRDTALPWDRIDSTRFRARAPLDTAIDALASQHRIRTASDPDFQYLLRNVEATEALRNQTTISLNLEERRAELDREEQRRLERENDRRLALGLEALASLEDLEQEPGTVEAILLNQAMRLVAEMASLERLSPVQRRLLSGTEPARTEAAR